MFEDGDPNFSWTPYDPFGHLKGKSEFHEKVEHNPVNIQNQFQVWMESLGEEIKDEFFLRPERFTFEDEKEEKAEEVEEAETEELDKKKEKGSTMKEMLKLFEEEKRKREQLASGQTDSSSPNQEATLNTEPVAPVDNEIKPQATQEVNSPVEQSKTVTPKKKRPEFPVDEFATPDSFEKEEDIEKSLEDVDTLEAEVVDLNFSYQNHIEDQDDEKFLEFNPIYKNFPDDELFTEVSLDEEDNFLLDGKRYRYYTKEIEEEEEKKVHSGTGTYVSETYIQELEDYFVPLQYPEIMENRLARTYFERNQQYALLTYVSPEEQLERQVHYILFLFLNLFFLLLFYLSFLFFIIIIFKFIVLFLNLLFLFSFLFFIIIFIIFIFYHFLIYYLKNRNTRMNSQNLPSKNPF